MAVPESGIPTNALAVAGDDPRAQGGGEPRGHDDLLAMSHQIQVLHHQVLRAHAATLDAHQAIQERLIAGLGAGGDQRPWGRPEERR
ncbi:hypothetical protein [Streptoalloteichus hindustanus]|uniref:Uncharacterized protein n=1 Tax=Streptoalloteichus hindustanus TaxID=2017 RepID=A0A1M5PRV0_STRHI|nr:hypothetical protein [Streptoalloteichus hindustanus]SHH04249.1 hypothetical protein SAMN05444320_11943 [Streptoalloteichus hindustanus]